MLAWQWRVNPDNLALLTHGVGLTAPRARRDLDDPRHVVGPQSRQLGCPVIGGSEAMDYTLVLGSFAVVSAIGVLWWGLTARPSAARANLLAGLPEQDEAPAPPRRVHAPGRSGHPTQASQCARGRPRSQPRPGGASSRAWTSHASSRDQDHPRRDRRIAAHAERAGPARRDRRPHALLSSRLLGRQRPRSAAGRDPISRRGRHRPIDDLRRSRPRIRISARSSRFDDRGAADGGVAAHPERHRCRRPPYAGAASTRRIVYRSSRSDNW